MTTRRQLVLVVGLDRRLAAAAQELSARASCRCVRQVTPHEALRRLAAETDADWTVLSSSVLSGLDPATFVAAARDLLGDSAKIVVVGFDPSSLQAVQLRANGATACVARARHVHHPCLSLGVAA